MRHLLVTNDFPPKVGGIQSYLWELWRRLPADEVTVLTTPHEGSAAWDAAQAFRVERTREPVLLPHPGLGRRVRRLADEVDADLVLLDPALPVGLLGPTLGRPYGLVLHGAEITVAGRLPGLRPVLGRVLRGATVVVAAGGYPLAEAERAAGRPLPSVLVPPGVDTERFTPLDPAERRARRERHGLDADRPLVVSVSRLVPRKGMDVLIEAVAGVRATTTPGLQLAVAGSGRDRKRLERLAADRAVPVHFLGRVPDEDLPGLYGCADVFAMLCRNRWLGLEQEGFGIVFLEAAAAGVPQIVGRSGGAHEAIAHGSTGLVVRFPHTVEPVVAALQVLLHDADLRAGYARAGRERAVAEFSYDVLAERLGAGLEEHGSATMSGRSDTSAAGWRAELTGQPGLGIVRASVAGTSVYACVAVLATAFTDALGVVVAVVSGLLFFVGTGAFLWAYAIAIGRSRTDAIGMGGLFFLAGSAPPVIQRVLMGSLAAEVVVAVVTASLRTYTELAFGVLVPMWGLGLAGLWGARHGVFPPREADGPGAASVASAEPDDDADGNRAGATGT